VDCVVCCLRLTLVCFSLFLLVAVMLVMAFMVWVLLFGGYFAWLFVACL